MTAELSNKARAEVRRHRLLAIGAILIAAGAFAFLALGGLGLKFKMTDGSETVTVSTDRLMIKHDDEYQAPGKGDSRSVKELAGTLEPTASGEPR